MPKSTPALVDRNKQIAHALYSDNLPLKVVAQKFSLSESQTSRAGRAGLQAEQFALASTRPEPVEGRPALPQGITRGIGSTGLRRFAGTIDEEYERALKSLTKRCATYKEMADDPVVAAVLQAIKMTLRRVSWRASTDGKTDADKRARDFLETSMHDMTQSWTDSIDQALGMMQYGFYPAEMVYKKRMGYQPIREGGAAPKSSLYTDGRIGWGEWIFIAPDSLAAGNEWHFDDADGTLLGLRQSPPPDYIPRYLPLQKLILFRTTSEKGNPEGRAILRGMYKPWWFKNNMEEIEGISAERVGTGFPVIYLGEDVQTNPDSENSALGEYRNIATNVRADELMGAVFPHKKLGTGAPDNKGVLFELISPPGKGAIDFHQVISRYEQRMSMVGLAQFIHLGMNQVGARALGETSLDFFTLAVSAWADSLADTINRQAVDTLVRLNHFPGLTTTPYISHEPVMKMGLGEMSKYISDLVGVQVLIPDAELEAFVREYADLPEKAVELNSQTETEAGELELDDTAEEEMKLFSANYANYSDSIMVALYPSRDLAHQMVVPGGEEANALHITLALPSNHASDLTDIQREQLINVVRGFSLISRPLNGNLTGSAKFAGKDGISPYVALVDIPSLPAWRQRLVEILTLNGFKVANDHGYIPHITVAYLPDSTPEPAIGIPFPTPVAFDRITLTIGEKRIAFKLGGGDPVDESLDVFASVRGQGRPGAKRSEEVAVNAYQRALEQAYSAWADDCAAQLAQADTPDQQQRILDDELPGLLAALRDVGRRQLPGAVTYGAGNQPLSPAMLAALAEAVAANETELADTLIPAVRRKLEAALQDGDIAAALASGSGAEAIRGTLAGLGGRVSTQAGNWWTLFNGTVGEAAKEADTEVLAHLDPRAKHCDDCPSFHAVGGKVYASMQDYLDATGNRLPGEFQCGRNCRCWLEVGGAKQKRA